MRLPLVLAGSGLRGMVGAGRVEKAAWVEPPVPASMKRQVSNEHGGLSVGKGVFQTKFGEGVLLKLEGAGTDALAQVNFGRHGTRWLALSVAQLTPID
jgi:DNA helicase II / ATP-dependent DNA helicase PcrA